MVDKVYIEECRSRLYAVCEGYVGLARFCCARWMVVRDNYLCSKQFNCALKDNFVIYNRCLNAALTNLHTVDNPRRRGEENHPALLVVKTVKKGAKDRLGVVAAEDVCHLLSIALCRTATNLCCCGNLCCTGKTNTLLHSEARQIALLQLREWMCRDKTLGKGNIIKDDNGNQKYLYGEWQYDAEGCPVSFVDGSGRRTEMKYVD